jgi:hypothetical protein
MPCAKSYLLIGMFAVSSVCTISKLTAQTAAVKSTSFSRQIRHPGQSRVEAVARWTVNQQAEFYKLRETCNKELQKRQKNELTDARANPPESLPAVLARHEKEEDWYADYFHKFQNNLLFSNIFLLDDAVRGLDTIRIVTYDPAGRIFVNSEVPSTCPSFQADNM